jgi:hypothetical protein
MALRVMAADLAMTCGLEPTLIDYVDNNGHQEVDMRTLIIAMAALMLAASPALAADPKDAGVRSNETTGKRMQEIQSRTQRDIVHDGAKGAIQKGKPDAQPEDKKDKKKKKKGVFGY